MKKKEKRDFNGKTPSDHLPNSGIIDCSGKIETHKTNINGVCWCNCKGKGSTVHGWSAQGGPFK